MTPTESLFDFPSDNLARRLSPQSSRSAFRSMLRNDALYPDARGSYRGRTLTTCAASLHREHTSKFDAAPRVLSAARHPAALLRRRIFMQAATPRHPPRLPGGWSGDARNAFEQSGAPPRARISSDARRLNSARARGDAPRSPDRSRVDETLTPRRRRERDVSSPSTARHAETHQRARRSSRSRRAESCRCRAQAGAGRGGAISLKFRAHGGRHLVAAKSR